MKVEINFKGIRLMMDYLEPQEEMTLKLHLPQLENDDNIFHVTAPDECINSFIEDMVITDRDVESYKFSLLEE